MALQDILEKIRTDGAADIAAIETARDVELAAIADKHKQFVEERTKAAAEDTKRRAEKAAGRILAKARHQAQFIAGSVAHAELEAVFSAVQAELAALDEATYTAFLTKQFASLPKAAARFVVAKDRAEHTIAFLTNAGVSTDAITTEEESRLGGGFIANTDVREFDCSFKGLLQTIKDKESVTIAQKLSA